MSNLVIGQTLITADGLNALANASATGISIKPKYFRVTDQDLTLHPNLSASDINGWITQDIDQYSLIDDQTPEFIADITPTEAIQYGRVIGLYLDDDTLFMVAKPPYPFPPSVRQTYKIQLHYTNSTQLVDFRYISHSEEERYAAILDASLTSFENLAHEMAFTRKITHIQGVSVR